MISRTAQKAKSADWTSPDGSVRLLHGDCLDVLAGMEADSVDAVVTDPPYGLEFMGQEWDKLGEVARANRGTQPERKRPPGEGGESQKFQLPAPAFDLSLSSQLAVQAWHQRWATAALRVLKPGGHLVAFGGTRTHHRLWCALEDAGFEVRDTLCWLYGSGFPKSLDVSKAIDRQRDDYEPRCRVTEWLRPHIERIGFDVVTRAFGFKDETMARARWTTRSQPQTPTCEQWEQLRGLCGFNDEMDAEVWRLNGRKGQPGDAWAEREVVGVKSYAGPAGNDANFGVGELGSNPTKRLETASATDAARQWDGWGTALKPAWEPIVLARKPLSGTVAANVLAHGTGALNVDGCRLRIEADDSIHAKNPHTDGTIGVSGIYGKGKTTRYRVPAGRWPANMVLDEEAAAMLDAQSGESRSSGGRIGNAGGGSVENVPVGQFQAGDPGYGDSGGASRFFYCAKASRAERGAGNNHPTVKPLALMRWLVRLVTPPGGLILDPFVGSGTTALAAIAEGFRCIGIDNDEEYLKALAKRSTQIVMPLEAAS